jgi:methionine sulfoxide reductase heme-binding subunit
VTRRRALTALLILLCAAPAAWLAFTAAFGDLGANPIETVEHTTGAWALRLLLATLAVTPLRRLTGWHAIASQRRTLGLAAFAYVVTHFFTWSVLDNGLDWASIAEDIGKRPFVTVGFTAFVLLIPLALTSTRASIRRLGKRWVALHRLVYVAAALGVLHFFWLVKKDLRPPLVYAAVLAALFGMRVWFGYSKSRSSTVRRPSARAFSMARSQSPRTASESGVTTRSDVLNPERPRT